jgi:hypothetical protein
MSAGGMTRLERLPANVATVLTNFLDEARDTLGDDLVSAVLFGSAAEARLTATSDVNLILVLRAFGPETLWQLSDPVVRAPPVRPVIAHPARNSRIASSRSNR